MRAPARLARRPRRRKRPEIGSRRLLVPFTRGRLEPSVLDAAIRIARAEEATLVPAYLILIPLQFGLDAPMSQECGLAIPLLEAVEHAASRARVPVDARIESGRTPIHALRLVPAPASREPGFSPDELLWMLTHAPSETLILRPDPALRAALDQATDDRTRIAPSLQRSALSTGTTSPLAR